MADMTKAELEARLAELEAENEELRAASAPTAVLESHQLGNGSGSRQAVVNAPYVWYRAAVPSDFDPRESTIVQLQAGKGTTIREDAMLEGEFDRLLRITPAGRLPMVLEQRPGMPAEHLHTQVAVGAATGRPTAEQLALQEAVARTRNQLKRYLTPDDPEYHEDDPQFPGPGIREALAERAGMTVKAGPGGYAPGYGPQEPADE